jgi:hypothetical protein
MPKHESNPSGDNKANAEILEMDTKIGILEPDVLQILLQQNDDPTKDINRN